MKEKKCLTGYQGRRWHGDEMVQLQMESLDVLQGLFGTIGACVVSGCGLSYNSGTGMWTVAAGIVALNHADGFKCARLSSFSFSNAAPTIYLSIVKTTNSKLYNDLSNRAFEDDYTVTSGTIASGVENVDYLVVYRPAGIRTFRQAMSFSEVFTTVTAAGVGVGSISASFKYRKNVLNNTLELIGTATLGNNVAIPSSGVWDVIVTLPSGYRPVTQQAHFVALPTSNVWNANSTDYLNPMTVKLSTTGDLQVFFQKAASGVTAYSVSFSVIIPLS